MITQENLDKNVPFHEINEDSNDCINSPFKKLYSNELSVNNCYNDFPLNRLDSKFSLQSNKSNNNNLLNKNYFNNSLLVEDDFKAYNPYYEEIDEKDILSVCENDNFAPASFGDDLDLHNFVLVKDDKILEIQEQPNIDKKVKDNIFSIVKDKNHKIEKNNNKKCVFNNIKKNKYFPFTKGKGNIFKSNDELMIHKKEYSIADSTRISQSTSNISSVKKNKKNKNFQNNSFENVVEDLKEDLLSEEISNKEPLENLNDNFLFKFTTKKYYRDENGKKKRVKKKRKFKSDDIRKKIKARFHKIIRNIINENLKKAGSLELFDFLPQIFVGSVCKKINSKYFDLTYKELLSTDFIEEIKKPNYQNGNVDKNKYLKNIKVLKYLEKNPEISKRSGFDLIKNQKYKDIIQLYFNSEEFEQSLIKLKKEKESPEYIQEYIKRAKTYISFYTNEKNGNDIKIIDIKEEIEDDENI